MFDISIVYLDRIWLKTPILRDSGLVVNEEKQRPVYFLRVTIQQSP